MASVETQYQSVSVLTDLSAIAIALLELVLASVALRQYLDSYINSPRQLASIKSNQRISARERLSGLSQQQLLDLSTDVYDEIDRRLNHANDLPFLPIRPDLHQKRNQARQKLATMGTAPFKDFASDIMAQIERRFPQYVDNYNMKYGISQGGEMQEQTFGNQTGPMSPPLSARPRDASPMNDLGGVSNDVVDRMRSDYESKLSSMRARIDELEKIAEEKSDLASSYNKLDQEFIRLKEDYDLLQDEYNHQQQTANDIKTEAANLLEEIKDMQARNEKLAAELDFANKRIRELSSQPPPPKSAPPPVNRDPPTIAKDENINSGVIDRERVTAYQAAVDDLLRAARGDAPSSVLVAMKSIVIACKTITEDTEHYEHSNNNMSMDDKDRLDDVKGRLSGALSGLMQAAKVHAQNIKTSPLSLLEAAASDLTATIVELVKMLKFKGESSGQQDSEQRSRQESEGYGVYELKIYLEKQTDLIVQSIQTLLHTMKQSSNGEDFNEIIIGITQTVSDVIHESDRTMDAPSLAALRDRAEPTLSDLNAANSKLAELGTSIADQPQSKSLKQKIASSAYEIAKYIKELINQVE